MTDQNEPSGPTSKRMHRSRDERLLFGVCAGVADYFGVDPTLVRIGFILVGLFPPTSALSLVGYLVLAVILPEEGVEELPGRERVKRNVGNLRTEFSSLANTVRERITGEPRADTSVFEPASTMAAGATAPKTPTTAPTGVPMAGATVTSGAMGSMTEPSRMSEDGAPAAPARSSASSTSTPASIP
jgi:phage shock protein C